MFELGSLGDLEIESWEDIGTHKASQRLNHNESRCVDRNSSQLSLSHSHRTHRAEAQQNSPSRRSSVLPIFIFAYSTRSNTSSSQYSRTSDMIHPLRDIILLPICKICDWIHQLPFDWLRNQALSLKKTMNMH